MADYSAYYPSVQKLKTPKKVSCRTCGYEGDYWYDDFFRHTLEHCIGHLKSRLDKIESRNE